MSPALTRRLKVGIEIPSSAAPSRVFNKGSFCRSMLSTERFSIHSNGELGNGRAPNNLYNILPRIVQEYDSFSRFVQVLFSLSFFDFDRARPPCDLFPFFGFDPAQVLRDSRVKVLKPGRGG